MEIVNVTKSTLLANRVIVAETFWKRLAGLLRREGLGEGEALVIRPCSSIHTFFMCFPIDVIFLDRDLKVRKVIQDMRPFRLSRLVFSTKEVIELPSGVISSSRTEVKDLIKIQP